MGYSKADFDREIAEALNNAWQAVKEEFPASDIALLISPVFTQYVGDKPFKRELQILLDKFSELSDAEMCREDDIDNLVDELHIYSEKAKMLLSIMDMKIEKIVPSPSKIGLGAFADGRGKEATIGFIKKVQLLIDLM